ncbi:hypothetical protein QP373_04555 [Lactobacillus crispatus]|uniref:hypothetical protein n=1 Tax=Lactobacillus crispatus TaxID=47770 RepID=UPI002550054A|nr:hypothetical protein [Lactobacillus crispatus]MDK7065377.1 hypothetical protein [Lactobacillus crispatus]
MKRLLFPQVSVNDDFVLKKLTAIDYSKPVRLPSIKVKLVQIGDAYCAVNIENGKAERFDNSYLFSGIPELMWTAAKEYNVYLEDKGE